MKTGEDGGRALHVFDMDGTLLRSTASIELARQAGQLEVGLALENNWYENRITNVEFWRALLEICQEATEADFDEAFHNAPWMVGIERTFEDIRSRGEDVIVISQSPAFFVHKLKQWGAHETFGSAIEIGKSVDDSSTLTAEAKVQITESMLAARSIRPENCIVYGDSSSDVELFKRFSYSVGVNPDAVLAPLAATSYVGTNIYEAYSMGRRLIESTVRQ